MIREEEPPKPSTRLSESGDRLASISANRHMEPARLAKLMRGDLDWILMKCLEKDRKCRYETANGLAVDILRHLNDEPVTAGPPSAWYKFRKFVRRNRAQVIATGIVAGVLVLGVVGTTSGMIWALNEKDRANEETTKATLAAESEAKARKRAETISEFVTTALKAGDAESSGAEEGAADAGYAMTILAAMDNAIRDIDAGRFKDDPETEAELRMTIGIILRNNGRYDQARSLLEQVLAMRERLYNGDDPIVAHSLFDLAEIYRIQGQDAQAEPLATRVLTIWEKLVGPDHPNVAKSLHQLAVLYRAQGKFAQAEPLFTRALAIRETALGPDHLDVAMTLNSLAVFYKDQGQDAQAEPLCKRALAIREQALRPDHPDVANSLSNLANLYKHPDQYALAEELQTRALAIREQAYGPDHTEVANSLNNLGALYVDQGQHTKAEPLLLRALVIWEKAFGPDHATVLLSKGNLAGLYWSQGKLDKSVPLFEEVLEAQDAKLGRPHPDSLHTAGNLGVNYLDAGRPAEAIPLLEEAYRASKQYPQLRFTGPALANVYRAQGQFDQAELLYTEVLASTEKTRGPDHPAALRAKGNLATLYWSRGRLDKSIPLFEEALEGLEAKLGRRDVETLTMVGNLGVNYLNAGRLTEAITLLEEAYQASKQYAQLGFAGPELLVAYIKAADPARPESIARVVVLIQEKLAALRGALPKDSPQLAAQLALSGQALLTVKAWDEAWPLVREALTIREAKAPDDWTTSNTRSLLGEVLLGQHKLTEAEPLLLDGYRGIMQREAAIPASAKVRIPEALQRLVRLYEAKSDETEAAAWRSRLEAALAEQAKPEAKGSGR
jgi:tetratricopeptide (TPR) repeat protein